jgi:hypothetical protein
MSGKSITFGLGFLFFIVFLCAVAARLWTAAAADKGYRPLVLLLAIGVAVFITWLARSRLLSAAAGLGVIVTFGYSQQVSDAATEARFLAALVAEWPVLLLLSGLFFFLSWGTMWLLNWLADWRSILSD